MNKTALITGATAELVKQPTFSKKQLSNNFMWKTRWFKELEEELAAITDVHCLQFDVRDKNRVFEAINSLPFSTIDILINAGNAHGLDLFKQEM
jgi:NADP-dependent 3-hydroxy acid dehydrogenase YdfG